jgi:hypothetical protein
MNDPTVFRNQSGRPVAVPHEVVMEADRPYRAYHHHLGGMSWEAVADLERYPSVEAVKSDVKRYLDEGRSLIREFSRAQLMERELGRLDALQHAIWAPAMAGHLPSINTAHSLVMTRIKLLRLDQDVRDEEGTVNGRTVVVVPSDDEGYARALGAAATVKGPSDGQ